MYLTHFGLREYPFGLTPDTGSFFASRGAQEALNTLLIALQTGEGFIKITGEVGTGKTMLCRKLLTVLGEPYRAALVVNPYLDPRQLYATLASDLGAEAEGEGDERQWVRALTHRLLQLAQQGWRVVVLIDEAQAMPLESIEALRLLTNLETQKRKLMQVVVFGQPELDRKLDHVSVRQLRQRIGFEYEMPTLERAELAAYLQTRLDAAGAGGRPLFSAGAKAVLAWATQRVPRLVNIVAHKALLAAYGKNRSRAGIADVLAAAADTRSVRRLHRWARYGVVAFCATLTGLAAAWTYLR